MTTKVKNDLPGEVGGGDVLGLGDLAERFGVRIGTCFRWVVEGLPAADGGRAYLGAIKRGKTWITSGAAVTRFFAELPRSGPAKDVQEVSDGPAETAVCQPESIDQTEDTH